MLARSYWASVVVVATVAVVVVEVAKAAMAEVVAVGRPRCLLN